MERIDAHQHFWKFNPVRDSWIDDTMSVIQKDFLPGDLLPLLQEHQMDGCVTIQSDQSEAENDFQLANAAANDFIKGVVGWVDLQAENVEERLAHYSSYPKMKGFRHVLQGEANRSLMLQPAFKRGIGLLHRYGFTYDLLILPDQLQCVPELVRAFPGQRFVIDHLAKPAIRKKDITNWQKEINALGKLENLYCKISGMVTEADWNEWRPGDFTACMDTVVETFGTNRIMYGSDWPVCLVASSYRNMFAIVQDYFAGFTTQEQEQFFGGNATRFYHL